MCTVTGGGGRNLEVVSIEFDPQGFHNLILRSPLLVCATLPWLENDDRPLYRLLLVPINPFLSFYGLSHYASAAVTHRPHQVVDVLWSHLHHGECGLLVDERGRGYGDL